MTAELERRYTTGSVDLADAGKRTIGGYAAVFGKLSQNLGGFVEVVEPTFFNNSKGMGWPHVMARYNHDDNLLLGTTAAGTLRLQVDGTGLDYRVDVPRHREDAYELVQRGDVRKSSFAFRLPEQDGDRWGLSDQGYPLRRLVTGQLVDVAPVTAPAYLDTSVGLRSLARWCDADPADVEAAAQVNELRRFLALTGSTAPMPKPATQHGPRRELEALLARQQDPWATPARVGGTLTGAEALELAQTLRRVA